MVYKNLFSEIKFGKLLLKNRIIFAPISTNLADVNGNVTSELIYHYKRRAQGGASLIILENMCIIFPDSRNGTTQPRIDLDSFIPGLSKISSQIHSFGALSSMELTHPGIYAEIVNTGTQPVGPSSLNLRNDGIIPKELDEKGIEKIIEGFAKAALRAKMAGYDSVEIEAAHGLLINQFLSPYTNRRNDRYGGSIENRLVIAELIIERIRDYCGQDFPVSARIPVMDNVKGGIIIDDGVKIAKGFEDFGYCAIHADFGLGDKEKRLEPMQYTEGWRVFLSKALKDAGIKIPVIAVGMIRNPAFAEKVLDSNIADLIALGRALIADPDWPVKAFTNNERKIKRCIGCSECIKARHDEGTAIRCGINPLVGKNECDEILIPAINKKKILVIGSGISGLEFAITAKLRGHYVEIWEKNEKIGGALRTASIPPGKEKLLWLLEYYNYMVKELNIEIKFNKEAFFDEIRSCNFDTIIVATGSKCYLPETNGKKNVIPARKVLDEKLTFKNKKIIVGGGGLVGCETALYLALQGNDVTIVEMLPNIAIDMENLSRNYLIRELKKNNVKIITEKKIQDIYDQYVMLENGEKIEMDYFVVAFGGFRDYTLFNRLKEYYETYVIGDASHVGKIIDAVSSGFFLGKII